MSSVDDFNTGAGNDLNANAYQHQQRSGDQQSEDYGDKGLDMLEKKTGHSMSKETNEKITDSAREGIEKVTGKQVPSKWSN